MSTSAAPTARRTSRSTGSISEPSSKEKPMKRTAIAAFLCSLALVPAAQAQVEGRRGGGPRDRGRRHRHQGRPEGAHRDLPRAQGRRRHAPGPAGGAEPRPGEARPAVQDEVRRGGRGRHQQGRRAERHRGRAGEARAQGRETRRHDRAHRADLAASSTPSTTPTGTSPCAGRRATSLALKVADDVPLEAVSAGDRISITYTEALAIEMVAQAREEGPGEEGQMSVWRTLLTA